MKKIATSKGIFKISTDGIKATSKGEVYIICPACTPSREPKHRNEAKLAVNINKDPNPWRCNHCGEFGYVLTEEYVERMKVKPLMENVKFLQINEPLVKWFWDKRKIGLQTMKDFDISMNDESVKQLRTKEGREHEKGKYVTRKCINFKYKKDGILINIKFRDPSKNFKLIPGATLIPFNMDSIKDSKICVIVEGEFDCMAYHEAGIKTVISVPNGATVTAEEKKHFEETGHLLIMSNINLVYLDPVIDDLAHIEMFYIATDDDAPGVKLREELARRLGYERCKYIRFGDYKTKDGKKINDPNELLIERGKAVLAGTLDSAHSFPINDVTNADEYIDIILKNYHDGKSKGISTGYYSLDPHFNWVMGWPYVFNGFPNMGKTSLVLNLMAIAAVKYGWKWGIYCPENYPVENVIEIISMILIGKTIDTGYEKRISEGELVQVIKGFINKHFFFVENEDGFSPEALRKIKKRMIQQHGIIGFLTDPWSSLNHDVVRSGDIDAYLQNELNHEVRLTTKYNLINIICHHPRTPKSKAEAGVPPTVFELTGGKYWWIKMYSAVSIHQESFDDWKNNLVGFHVQKQKDKQKAGETTSSTNYPILRYDKLSRRFYEKEKPGESSSKYTRFPFQAYLDSDQHSLFDGF